jgi:hypothetical protein
MQSALAVSLTAIALLAGTAASGQTVQTIQTLDRVDVYNKAKVLEMEFDDPGRTFDFTALDITPATAAGFSACQVTATQALYCIDGKDVRYWAKPSQVAVPNTNGSLLFSCTDAALGLDGASANPCTGLTVDLSGAIWLAGKKAASYSLFKLVARTGSTCSSGVALAASAYCATEYAAGPRAFVDLTPIDGDVGAAFKGPGGVPGPGVLGLEQDPPNPLAPAVSRTTLFFPVVPMSVPIVIASGDAQWGLVPGEHLQSVTLQQLTIAGVTRNFALATTSNGRILAVDTLGTSNAFPVFDIVAERIPVPPAVTASQCNFDPQRYVLRASTKSGRVYLTDRNYCQAVALESAVVGNTFQLRNVQEGGSDLTFSTTAAYPPDADTIAPGIIVNLSTCGIKCTLLSDANGAPAATLSGVNVLSSQSGMTLFQVKDIPDCRWDPGLCAGKNDVVIDANGNSVALGTQPANALFLNVTPLLPLEITALFDSSGVPPKGLPRMLISPQYRAQKQTQPGPQQGHRVFEAFFGITEQGVVFTDTFSGEFDVLKLAGEHLGCGYDYSEAKKPNLTWDVVTTVSEKAVTAGGPNSFDGPPSPNHYVDTLVNTGCYNPTKISGDRWSMYAYNLEIAPKTDAVLAKLLVSLYDDLEETRHELTCETHHTGGGPLPISDSVCSSLKKQWDSGKAKLDKCVKASTQPKSSAGSENCQSFLTQLKGYQSTLNSATTTAALDPANRLGELKARVLVLIHVYSDRFLPSIPKNGFTNL